MTSLSPVRLAAVAYARSIDGLTAPDPRYLALVAPAEVASGDTRRALEIATLSGCALVAHGILDAVLRLPERAPYVTGRAIADLLDVARAAGALRRPSERPSPGDVVHVGAPSEHVYTVAQVEPGEGDALELVSVDGGQRVGAADPERGTVGAETIRCYRRHIAYKGPWAQDSRDGIHRPVLTVLDLDAMAAFYQFRL